jgi:hypothetical protein
MRVEQVQAVTLEWKARSSISAPQDAATSFAASMLTILIPWWGILSKEQSDE